LLLGEAGSVAFVVGPEGGLTEGELRALEGDGWIAASLGPATLRTETVAAAVLGALLLGAP
jgi:16S rRNA (uracil1498-N3)-methyltransferase